MIERSIDLAANPDIVFHIFGEREDPRMMPFAAVRGNDLIAITLPETDWREFDTKYLKPGVVYPVFRDGLATGTAAVKRGMWTGEPLYTLPQCKSLTPMASVTVADSSKAFVVEAFATTRAARPARPRGTSLSPDSVRAIGNRLARQVAKTVDLEGEALDSLDFRVLAIVTGARAKPTIVASFVDPRGGDVQPGRGNTANVLVLADDDGTGYKVSFSHAVNADASRAEFRTYLDHLDMTGEGVDEILVEGWHYGEETSLHVLAWRNGTWHDVFTGRSSWCLDEKKK